MRHVDCENQDPRWQGRYHQCVMLPHPRLKQPRVHGDIPADFRGADTGARGLSLGVANDKEISLPTTPPSQWGKIDYPLPSGDKCDLSIYTCESIDVTKFADECLSSVSGITSFNGSPAGVPPTPAWILNYSTNALGITTNLSQDQMISNTETPSPIPALTCNGNSGFGFGALADLETGNGFVPNIYNVTSEKPCQSPDTAFECFTTLKNKNTGKPVPITMPGVNECPTPLPAQPYNCYEAGENSGVYGFVYYCPAT